MNDSARDASTIFTYSEIKERFDGILGKSFGEIDLNDYFLNSKNKGIAGHIIEKCVLGYDLNSNPHADILVDGVETEVKTTGMRKIDNHFVAKEPVSITEIDPKIIITEEFERSHFWNKVHQMIFVYYFYDYNGPFDVQQYRRFIVQGYQLRIIPDEDKAVLESDWTIVRDYIRDAQQLDVPESAYPDISHLQLMYTDTAPKFHIEGSKIKQYARFRFKRAYVNSFMQEYFYGVKRSKLTFFFDKYAQFDERCAQLTDKYRGMTVLDLLDYFQICTKTIHKAISERIILKMFDSDAQKINDIEIFNKLGLIGKSIVQSVENGRTEDMKLFKIDFEEIRNANLKFEDSQFYTYFKEYQLLTILFQEQTKKDVKFGENRFIGFKRISFSEEFIQTEVRPVWEKIRKLVNNNKLKEVFLYDNKGNIRLTPKTKLPISAPNFPKSGDNLIFVRGSGTDKTRLPQEINGIRMLTQYLWIRGRELNEVMNDEKSF